MNKKTEKWMIEKMIPSHLVPVKFSNKSHKASLSKSIDLPEARKPYGDKKWN